MFLTWEEDEKWNSKEALFCWSACHLDLSRPWHLQEKKEKNQSIPGRKKSCYLVDEWERETRNWREGRRGNMKLIYLASQCRFLSMPLNFLISLFSWVWWFSCLLFFFPHILVWCSFSTSFLHMSAWNNRLSLHLASFISFRHWPTFVLFLSVWKHFPVSVP